LHVIVLDSSPTSRKILEVILRREGHQVACFGDSLEALRALSRHGPADLLTEYPRRGISDQGANRREEHPACDDGGLASRPGGGRA